MMFKISGSSVSGIISWLSYCPCGMIFQIDHLWEDYGLLGELFCFSLIHGTVHPCLVEFIEGNIKNIWVRSQRWASLVTWFCYHLIAKPGNKTGAPLWPDPYLHFPHFSKLRWCCKLKSFLLEDKDQFIPRSIIHGFWWPGTCPTNDISIEFEI